MSGAGRKAWEGETMHVEPTEKGQFLKGYRMVRIIWVAILASLPFYYFVCMAVGDQIWSELDAGYFTVVRQTLLGLSILTLMAVHFQRNILLKKGGAQSRPGDAPTILHPSVARYTVVIVRKSVRSGLE